MSKFFGIKEASVFLVVIAFILIISAINFDISFKRERNGLRRNDLTQIAGALAKFYKEYGFYPDSIDEKIADCIGEKTVILRRVKIFKDAAPCNWGKDFFSLDPTDKSFPRLLDSIPPDPLISKGYSYLYYSNGRQYQLYASYELSSEADYNKNIEKLSLKCGIGICNTGKASLETALDKPFRE